MKETGLPFDSQMPALTMLAEAPMSVALPPMRYRIPLIA
jgi:hypothetical protein